MANKGALIFSTTKRTILELSHLYDIGRLDLEPGFQRQSVWQLRDRIQLVDSLLRNYPIPAIFLYKNQDKGRIVFQVIDGKQRLESMFMFMGKIWGQRFSTKSQLPGSDDNSALEMIDWRLLVKRGLQNSIEGYEVPVVEVDGDFSDIIECFVRINSTGKALTKQEKRHAKYYNSIFLKQTARLANKYKDYFLRAGIFSQGNLGRMKHVEFVAELMLSLVQGDVLNKKTALDRVMKNSIDQRQTAKASRLATATLNRIAKMFPQLRGTRLRRVTDFYSLAVLIGKFEQEGLILTDRKRNRLAWEILREFSTKVDGLREQQRKMKGTSPGEEIYRDYLLTVSQMTDDVSQRRNREKILSGLIRSLFERKDSQRGFSSEQRRIIWNTATSRSCQHPGCRKILTWDDFTVDHINPHSKGGRSQLENAALMCRQHNSSKGNKTAARKRAA